MPDGVAEQAVGGAVRYHGHNAREVCRAVGLDLEAGTSRSDSLALPTKGGDVDVCPGDWIVRDATGGWIVLRGQPASDLVAAELRRRASASPWVPVTEATIALAAEQTLAAVAELKAQLSRRHAALHAAGDETDRYANAADAVGLAGEAEAAIRYALELTEMSR